MDDGGHDGRGRSTADPRAAHQLRARRGPQARRGCLRGGVPGTAPHPRLAGAEALQARGLAGGHLQDVRRGPHPLHPGTPQHHPGVRRRHRADLRGRARLHHHGVRGGRQPGAAGRLALRRGTGRGGHSRTAAGRRGPRRRPRAAAPHRAPRPVAGQRAHHLRRVRAAREGERLRAGQGDRPGHEGGQRPGDGRLHAAGGAAPGHGLLVRRGRLGARHHRVLPAHRPLPVRRRRPGAVLLPGAVQPPAAAAEHLQRRRGTGTGPPGHGHAADRPGGPARHGPRGRRTGKDTTPVDAAPIAAAGADGGGAVRRGTGAGSRRALPDAGPAGRCREPAGRGRQPPSQAEGTAHGTADDVAPGVVM